MKEEADAGAEGEGGRRGEMCGIFACLNYNVKRERSYILQVLFMASLPTLVFRQEGNIESLVKSVYQEVDATDLNLEETFLTHAGIAHTRWATDGEPAPRNSHPQSSGAENEFLVVHNGVITNHEVTRLSHLVKLYWKS